MGIYDNVRYTAPCPKCGQELTDWQTKGGPGGMLTVEPHEVETFYTTCPACKTWVDADVDAEVEVIVKKCEITLNTRDDDAP